MSAALGNALKPLFAAMKAALGPEAKQATVAVAGGMYMEHRKIRTTKVSTIHLLRCRVRLLTAGHQDIDLFLQLNGNITHMQFRDKILQLNKAFTPNLQKKCSHVP